MGGGRAKVFDWLVLSKAADPAPINLSLLISRTEEANIG